MVDCTWDNPGYLPARGLNIATMISHYNYPKSDLAELVEKVRTTDADGVAVITKNGVTGIGGTIGYFGDMHSKTGPCKGRVDTSSWPMGKEEKALVYCSVNNNCIAIPVVCGNVTKVTWQRNERQIPKEFVVPKPNTVPVPSTLWLVGLSFYLLSRSRNGIFLH